MNHQELKKLVDSQKDWIISIRRKLHRIPEDGFKEFKTQQAVMIALEEIGIRLEDLKIIGTDWFARKEQLMIGFLGRAKKAEFTLSCEVEEAHWVPVAEAPALMHPGKAISTELVRRYLEGLDSL